MFCCKENRKLFKHDLFRSKGNWEFMLYADIFYEMCLEINGHTKKLHFFKTLLLSR